MEDKETKLRDEKILKFAEQKIILTTETARRISPGVSIVKVIRRLIPKYRKIEWRQFTLTKAQRHRDTPISPTDAADESQAY